jgi:thioredoxin reductase
LTAGKANFSPDELSKLKAHNIEIIETEVSEIEHENAQVKTVIFKDEIKKDFTAIYAAVPFIQHSDIPVSLGCELTEHGHLKVDNFQATTVKGIFACGDNAAMMRSIANSVYSGNLAGAIVNKELTEEQF